ncbi:hypothetical protein ACFW2I_40350 [Streptomyces nigra]
MPGLEEQQKRYGYDQVSMSLLEQLASIRILADGTFDQFLASRRPRLAT